MSKEITLMRDVICKYHPEFIASRSLRKYGMNSPELFNVERLVEDCLESVSGLRRVNADFYDFEDYSDSKTGSVSQNTRLATIRNVESKIGALRVTIYNPHYERLDYFFVPSRYVKLLRKSNGGKYSYKQRIVFTFNCDYDHYNSFNQFWVSSFDELANSKDS